MAAVISAGLLCLVAGVIIAYLYGPAIDQIIDETYQDRYDNQGW